MRSPKNYMEINLKFRTASPIMVIIKVPAEYILRLDYINKSLSYIVSTPREISATYLAIMISYVVKLYTIVSCRFVNIFYVTYGVRIENEDGVSCQC